MKVNNSASLSQSPFARRAQGSIVRGAELFPGIYRHRHRHPHHKSPTAYRYLRAFPCSAAPPCAASPSIGPSARGPPGRALPGPHSEKSPGVTGRLPSSWRPAENETRAPAQQRLGEPPQRNLRNESDNTQSTPHPLSIHPGSIWRRVPSAPAGPPSPRPPTPRIPHNKVPH